MRAHGSSRLPATTPPRSVKFHCWPRELRRRAITVCGRGGQALYTSAYAHLCGLSLICGLSPEPQTRFVARLLARAHVGRRVSACTLRRTLRRHVAPAAPAAHARLGAGPVGVGDIDRGRARRAGPVAAVHAAHAGAQHPALAETGRAVRGEAAATCSSPAAVAARRAALALHRGPEHPARLPPGEPGLDADGRGGLDQLIQQRGRGRQESVPQGRRRRLGVGRLDLGRAADHWALAAMDDARVGAQHAAGDASPLSEPGPASLLSEPCAAAGAKRRPARPQRAPRNGAHVGAHAQSLRPRAQPPQPAAAGRERGRLRTTRGGRLLRGRARAAARVARRPIRGVCAIGCNDHKLRAAYACREVGQLS
ncbi:hypothetical protein T492DRAFT_286167 [Pavlovales sp. CCMP2436]|nr:hypothetical protein T492DRAFT_286167 [Pavlovales sp. CCMP2436]